jgi:hypothetical protein
MTATAADIDARADATTAGPIQSFQACLQHR